MDFRSAEIPTKSAAIPRVTPTSSDEELVAGGPGVRVARPRRSATGRGPERCSTGERPRRATRGRDPGGKAVSGACRHDTPTAERVRQGTHSNERLSVRMRPSAARKTTRTSCAAVVAGQHRERRRHSRLPRRSRAPEGRRRRRGAASARTSRARAGRGRSGSRRSPPGAPADRLAPAAHRQGAADDLAAAGSSIEAGKSDSSKRRDRRRTNPRLREKAARRPLPWLPPRSGAACGRRPSRLLPGGRNGAALRGRQSGAPSRGTPSSARGVRGEARARGRREFRPARPGGERAWTPRISLRRGPRRAPDSAAARSSRTRSRSA